MERHLVKRQTSIRADLIRHIITKVTDAAEDVVQLVDADEVMPLYKSAIVVLLAEAILKTAPPGTSRADLLRGAKLVSSQLPLYIADLLKDLTDDEIEHELIQRQGD